MEAVTERLARAHKNWLDGLLCDQDFVAECGQAAMLWAMERVNGRDILKEIANAPVR